MVLHFESLVCWASAFRQQTPLCNQHHLIPRSELVDWVFMASLKHMRLLTIYNSQKFQLTNLHDSSSNSSILSTEVGMPQASKSKDHASVDAWIDVQCQTILESHKIKSPEYIQALRVLHETYLTAGEFSYCDMVARKNHRISPRSIKTIKQFQRRYDLVFERQWQDGPFELLLNQLGIGDKSPAAPPFLKLCQRKVNNNMVQNGQTWLKEHVCSFGDGKVLWQSWTRRWLDSSWDGNTRAPALSLESWSSSERLPVPIASKKRKLQPASLETEESALPCAKDIKTNVKQGLPSTLAGTSQYENTSATIEKEVMPLPRSVPQFQKPTANAKLESLHAAIPVPQSQQVTSSVKQEQQSLPASALKSPDIKLPPLPTSVMLPCQEPTPLPTSVLLPPFDQDSYQDPSTTSKPEPKVPDIQTSCEVLPSLPNSGLQSPEVEFLWRPISPSPESSTPYTHFPFTDLASSFSFSEGPSETFPLFSDSELRGFDGLGMDFWDNESSLKVPGPFGGSYRQSWG